MSHRAEVKARKREELRRLLQEVGRRDRLRRIFSQQSPYGHNCFSATCDKCGKVWLSAIRPIKPNAKREGRKVYLCGNCR